LWQYLSCAERCRPAAWCPKDRCFWLVGRSCKAAGSRGSIGGTEGARLGPGWCPLADGGLEPAELEAARNVGAGVSPVERVLVAREKKVRAGSMVPKGTRFSVPWPERSCKSAGSGGTLEGAEGARFRGRSVPPAPIAGLTWPGWRVAATRERGGPPFRQY
jgi:hypothetical protein